MTVTLTVKMVGPRDRRHGPNKIKLPRLVAPVKIQDDGVVLIIESVGIANPGLERRNDRAVEPFIGMQNHGQHSICVGAIENRFIYLRFALARKNLAHVSDAEKSLASRLHR